MTLGIDWADKPENIIESKELIDYEIERREKNESNI